MKLAPIWAKNIHLHVIQIIIYLDLEQFVALEMELMTWLFQNVKVKGISFMNF